MRIEPVPRYHPFLVALHWVLAGLLIAALAVGYFGLGTTPNSDPRKIELLWLHMAGGMLILALMVIRFIVRMRTAKPEDLTIGNRLVDRSASISHYSFYVLVVLMAGTGLATALLSGLNKIVFGGLRVPLPPTLNLYPTQVAHAYLARLLVVLVVSHGLAVFYNQYIRKDGRLRRMLIGRRSIGGSASPECFGSPKLQCASTGILGGSHGSDALLHLAGKVRSDPENSLHDHELAAMMHLVLFGR